MAPKIITRKEVCEGALIPKGYGVAYWDFCSERVICYPIPINFFVAWAKSCHIRLMRTMKTSWWERELTMVRETAYERGRHRGYMDGMMDWAKDILKNG